MSGRSADQPKAGYHEKRYEYYGNHGTRCRVLRFGRCCAKFLGMRSTRSRRNLHSLHRRDKPVTSAGQRFNESRLVGRVAEHLAKARNRIVKAMVEIDEGIGRPNLSPKLLSRDHLAGGI